MPRRPLTRDERRARDEHTRRFTNAVLNPTPYVPLSFQLGRVNYSEIRRYQYARRVERELRSRGYPSYAIRTAVRAIHDGKDPHYSLDHYYMEDRD